MSSSEGTSRGERRLVSGSSAGRKHRPLARLNGRTLLRVEQSSKEGRPEIYSLVTTTDLALLATLMHDAIGHLMNAIDKAAKVREPIDRIANAMEETATAVKGAIIACQAERAAVCGAKSTRSATVGALPLKPQGHERHRHSTPKAKA